MCQQTHAEGSCTKAPVAAPFDPVRAARGMSDADIARFALRGCGKAAALAYGAQIGLRTVPACIMTVLRAVRSLLSVARLAQRPSAAVASVARDVAALVRRIATTLRQSGRQARFAAFLALVVLASRLVVLTARRSHGIVADGAADGRTNSGTRSSTESGGTVPRLPPRPSLSTGTATVAAAVAGAAAAGCLLCVSPESRVGLALFVGVRAAEVLAKQLHAAGLVPYVPNMHGVLMALASGEIVYSLVFAPGALDASTCVCARACVFAGGRIGA